MGVISALNPPGPWLRVFSFPYPWDQSLHPIVHPPFLSPKHLEGLYRWLHEFSSHILLYSALIFPCAIGTILAAKLLIAESR